MAKATLKRKKTVFTRKLGLNLRKKLVKFYIWGVACYGAETWTLRKEVSKTWNVFKRVAVKGWRRPIGRVV